MHQGRINPLAEFVSNSFDETYGGSPTSSVQQAPDDAQRRISWRDYLSNFTGDGKLEPPKLAALRADLGFTQAELARTLGLPEETIANAEAGQSVSVFEPALQRFVHAATHIVNNQESA